MADWWVSAKNGHLPPVEQAKLWALTTMADEFQVKLPAHKITALLTKVGGGHPGQRAVQAWQEVFRGDPEWYPGKTCDTGASPGPKVQFTPQKKRAVAAAAMAIKRSGREPGVAEVRERCPAASLNPSTGAPFTDKYILQVFREHCADDGAHETWGHLVPYSKTALSPEMQARRLAWAKEQLKDAQPGHWFFKNVVWIDPCSTILHTSPRSTFDEKQATYGKGKRWMSPDARANSRNLRASPYAGKQCQFNDKRVWWFVVLARGVVKFLAMPDDFQQNGEGMAKMVDRLEDTLKEMVGDDTPLPRVIFTDRGPGFYQASTGHIVKRYQDALKRHHFRPYAGVDASRQPPDIPDCLPHETAVAWARRFMKKRPIPKSGGVTRMRQQLLQLLNDASDHLNSNYDVEKLCKGEFMKRMKELKVKKGARLKY